MPRRRRPAGIASPIARMTALRPFGPSCDPVGWTRSRSCSRCSTIRRPGCGSGRPPTASRWRRIGRRPSCRRSRPDHRVRCGSSRRSRCGSGARTGAPNSWRTRRADRVPASLRVRRTGIEAGAPRRDAGWLVTAGTSSVCGGAGLRARFASGSLDTRRGRRRSGAARHEVGAHVGAHLGPDVGGAHRRERPCAVLRLSRACRAGVPGGADGPSRSSGSCQRRRRATSTARRPARRPLPPAG